MVPELEKPRVMEIQVRMDCNGCVQKIKKALHGINGIYDLYIDFPQQKLIIIGWADPERIVKAIRKTRKVIGSVCVHTEPTEQAPEGTEPPPEGGAPPADTTVPPTNTDSPPQTTESTNPQTEPLKDPPPPENQVLEFHPTPVAIDATTSFQLGHHSGTKDIVEQIHVIHHHQHEYPGHLNNPPPTTLDSHMINSLRPPVDDHLNSYPPPPVDGNHGYWSNSTKGHSGFIRPEPPAYVSHHYNTHKPAPYMSEYEYVRSPPRQTRYSTRTEHYYSNTEEYQVRDNSSSSGNNITSIFSDENPNACRIV